MIIKHGHGATKYGPGITIILEGDEIATAIDAYLVAHNCIISGPRTITVNNELIEGGGVYVDPSGFVIHQGDKVSGRGDHPVDPEFTPITYNPNTELKGLP